MMRILTVKQPWAWAIIHGGKDVENRVRNLAGDYRGPVAIHAGLEFDSQGVTAIRQISGPVISWQINDYDVGAIIGVVDLVDVHNASVIGGCGRMEHDCPEHGTCRKHCSEWAFGPNPAGGWFTHLLLANPRPLAEPIPYKGALGMRTLPDDVEQQILAGLEPQTGETL